VKSFTLKETNLIRLSEHYQPGSIWFVSNFNFGHGIPTRDKYVVILKMDPESERVCFGLATTRIRYPEANPPRHGCNHFLGLGTSYFEPGRLIGNDGFAFEQSTHLYHYHDIHLEHYSSLEVYHIDTRADLLDLLCESEYNTLINCVVNSDSTKRGIKRFLLA
jgi:hypothetical protein